MNRNQMIDKAVRNFVWDRIRDQRKGWLRLPSPLDFLTPKEWLRTWLPFMEIDEEHYAFGEIRKQFRAIR